MKGTPCTLAGLLMLVACQQSKPPAPAAEPAPPVETPAAPAQAEPSAGVPGEAAADDTPSEAQLPVAEDFEEEATTAVNDENYKSELDAIEKELDNEP